MSIMYALPHKKDNVRLAEAVAQSYSNFNIMHSVQYCVSGYAHLEKRMYKYESHDIQWGTRHSLTFPEHFNTERSARFSGWYVHYKLHNFDQDAVAENGQFTNSVWSRINDGVIDPSWAHDKQTEVFANLPEFDAELCSDMVMKLCTSEGCDPPCKMYLFWGSALFPCVLGMLTALSALCNSCIQTSNIQTMLHN